MQATIKIELPRSEVNVEARCAMAIILAEKRVGLGGARRPEFRVDSVDGDVATVLVDFEPAAVAGHLYYVSEPSRKRARRSAGFASVSAVREFARELGVCLDCVVGCWVVRGDEDAAAIREAAAKRLEVDEAQVEIVACNATMHYATYYAAPEPEPEPEPTETFSFDAADWYYALAYDVDGYHCHGNIAYTTALRGDEDVAVEEAMSHVDASVLDPHTTPRDIAERLARYAVDAAYAAYALEDAFTAAETAHDEGDLDALVDALDEAARIERDFGDDPTVQAARIAYGGVVRCAYCAASVHAGDVPRADDDNAWAIAAREHYDGCEWIATKAHQA